MIVNNTIAEPIDNHSKAANILREWLAQQNDVDRDKEHIWAIGLDTKLNIKYVEVVSIGTLDSSLVHPREVFRFAIMNGISSLIIGHNHPSGDVSPSKEDRAVTKRLAAAGNLLGIKLLDHVIISLGGEPYSFAISSPEDLRA